MEIRTKSNLIKSKFLRFILVLILGVAACFAAIPGALSHAEETTAEPRIYVTDMNVVQGGSAYVYVGAENLSNVAGLQMELRYDADVMSVTNSGTYSLVSESYINLNTSTAGVVKFAAIDNTDDGISGTGSLFYIRFQINTDAPVGEYPLVVLVNNVYDADLNPISVSKSSAVMSVQERPATVGSIRFYNYTSASSLEQGDTLEYSIEASNSCSLAGGNFEFNYDDSLLTLEKVSIGEDLITDNALYSINKKTPGLVKISYINSDGITSYYTDYFVLTFSVKEDVETKTELSFKASSLVDINMNAVSDDTRSATVSITKKPVVVDYPDFKIVNNNDFNTTDKTFTVDVVLDKNANIAAGDFVVNYDASQVVCTKVVKNEAVTSDNGLIYYNSKIGEGQVKFSYVKEDPYVNETSLLTLTFQVVGDYFGPTVFTTTGSGLVDADYKDVTLDYPDFSYTILRDISTVEISLDNAGMMYDGTVKEPGVTAVGLTKDADYTVTYSNNINVGTATVTIAGIGNYTGTKELTFEITPADLLATDLQFSEKIYIYDGSAKTPAVVVMYGQKTLVEGTDYTVSYSDNTDAGVGIASVTVTGKGNYTGSKTEVFTIKPDEISNQKIELSETSFEYDGSVKEPTITVTDGDKVLVKDTDYTIAYDNNINAGTDTATVTITGKGNYQGAVTKTYSIVADQLSDQNISLSETSYTYDGSAKEPVVTIKDGDVVLIKDVDYTVTYGKNVNAGDSTAVVTITGIGNYQGAVTKNFTIVADEISKQSISLSTTSYTYDGTAKTPVVTVKDGTVNLKEGTDYTLLYSDNTAAGTATVTITGKGNYQGTIEKTFTIDPELLASLSSALSRTEYTYDGSEKTPELIITMGEIVLVKGTDYEVSYNNNTAAGNEATVVAEGKGNFAGMLEYTFTILPDAIANQEITLSDTSFSYTGLAIEPGVTVKDGDVVLKKGTDYSISYSNNMNAGEKTATVTVTGMGNYSGTKTMYFSIVSDSMANQSIELSQTEFVYDGNAKEPAVTVKHNGEVLEEGTDYRLSYYNNIHIGTGSVDVIGIGNYTNTITKNFTIVAADIANQNISLSQSIYEYDGSAKTPVVTVKAGNVQLVKDRDYTVVYEDNTAAGQAKVTIAGIGNYKGSVEKTFVITPDSIKDQVITLNSYEFTFDGSAKEPGVTVKDDGVELQKGTDYTVVYNSNTNAGTATVTITGTGNYTGTAEETFVINAKSIAGMTANLDEETFVFDGSKKEPAVAINGLVAGTDFAVAYSNNTNAGIATVMIKGLGNYQGTITKSFNINAADISKLEATLSETSFTYGKDVKEPVVTIDGLTEGTDFEVSYENNVDAGTATVTITGIHNYQNSISKTFTIAAADISQMKADLEKATYTYDGSAKTPAVTVGDLMEETDYEVSYEQNVDAGTGKVLITGKGNYQGTIEKIFTIEKADITGLKATLSATEYIYNGVQKMPGVAIDGLVSGTDFTVSYSDNIKAGTANVTIIGIGNYEGTIEKTFIVKPADIATQEISLSQTGYVYDQDEKTPDVTVKAGEKTLVKGTDYQVSYSNNVNVGTGVVTIKGIGNYSGEVTRKITINPASIADQTIGLSKSEYTYDGTEKVPTVLITDDGKELVLNTDYSVSYNNNINAGENTASVTIAGLGNYTGTVTKTYTILQADISGLTANLYKTEYVYDGSEKKPTATIDGLRESVDFDVTYGNNVNAGTAKVTLTGKGNYKGVLETEFVIKPADASKFTVSVDENLTFVYNGQPHTPAAIIDGDAQGTDFDVTYSNNVNAGTATITVKVSGNYAGTITGNFEIEPAGMENLNATLSEDLFTYTGSEKKPTVTIQGLIEGTDYTVSYTGNIGAGTATVTITGQGNYDGIITKTFQIQAASIDEMEAELEAISYVYDGSEKKPSVTVEGLTEGTDYEVSYSNNINAGADTATVTITGIGNYSGTIVKTFSIAKANIGTKEASLSEISFVYDGTEKEPVMTIPGLTAGKDYNVTYLNNIRTGTATAVATGIGNYTGTKTVTFTIGAKDISDISAQLTNTTFDYDGKAKEPAVTVVGLVDGIDYKVEYQNNTNAGKATALIGGIGNYGGTIKLEFTINPVPLTVTVKDAARYEGQENPDFHVEYKGFVQGEDASVLQGTVVFVCDADTESASGTYAITASGHQSSNYTISYVAGTLTVNKCTHDYGSTVLVAPKCEETGLKGFTCKICGHYYEEEMPVSGHTSVVDAEVPPTCEDTGLTEGSHCDVCSKVLEAQTVIPANGHDWDAGQITTEPGCETKGETTYTCQTCDDTKTEDIAPTDHSFGTVKVVDKAATCTTTGSMSYHCANCTVTKDAEEIPMLPHSYDDGKVTTQPTCEKDGVRTYTCSECKGTKTGVEPATGHSFGTVKVVDKEATCTTAGSKSYHCDNCSARKDAEEIPMLQHNYDAGVVTTIPSCEEDGVRTFTCTACSGTKTGVEPATGHSFSPEKIVDIVATCTSVGSKSYHCANCSVTKDAEEIPMISHSYDAGVVTTAPTCTSDGIKTYTCSACSGTKEEPIEKLGHNFGSEKIVDVAATCTTTGSKSYHCTRCDVTKDAEVIPALGHAYDSGVVTKQPTCEGTGIKTFTCATCNGTKTEILEATGHAYTSEVTAPTCTEKGYTTYTCSKCNNSYKDNYVDALGHTPVTDKAVSPTCTTSGLTEGSHCTVCNTVLVPQGVDPALGHNYTSEVTVPTCTAQGYTTHTCTRCNHVKKDTYVNAVGHSFGEWTTTKEPTCTTVGSERRECSKCNHYETNELKALGHDYKSVVTAPTCTTKGYTTHICARCQHSYIDTYISAFGHNPQLQGAKEASCTVEGYTGDKVCTVCKVTVEKGTAIAKKPHTTVVDKAVAATCTTEGKTEGSHCSVCNTVIKAQTTIPALGHKSQLQGAKESTCAAEGYTGDEVCTVCKVTLKKGTAIVKKPHTTVVDKAVAATCTTEGKTEGSHCSVCNTVIKAQTTVPALGHKTQLQNAKEATCTATGYTGDEVCTVCKVTVKKGSVINKKDHTWDAGTITTQATASKPGVKTYTCTVCKTTKTESVAFAGFDVERVFGASRYKTSLSIANELKAELGISKFSTVIIANGDNFPDALAGSYLAAKKSAPILMTNPYESASTVASNKNSTNAIVQAYIVNNLKAGGKVYILGGEAAVPAYVENNLRAKGYNVERLKGKGRYDTNLEILKEAGVSGDELLVCTGTNFADSLSASASGLPMLLVDPKTKTLTPAQKDFLDDKKRQIYIIGGSGAVDDKYVTALAAYDSNGTVERIKGASRYETSIEVAKRFCDNPNEAVIASAQKFPDGLCGGPLAYFMDAPLVLTHPTYVEKNVKPARDYISQMHISKGKALGGSGALEDDVVKSVFGMGSKDTIKGTKYN